MYLIIPKIGNEMAPKIVPHIREINTIKTHIFRLNRGFNEITHYFYKGLFEKILIASEWH